MRLLFKYASRNRPENFFRGLNSIVDNVFDKENYHIQCTFDSDDTKYNNKEFIDGLNTYKNLTYYFGTSTSKINAINRDIEKFPEFDILVNFSDDQIFTQMYFDDIIRQVFKTSFPDLDGFVHFHDGVQPRLATMSIIGKAHFDRFGFIYHPSFHSEWCDNFAQEAAIRLGKYKYMGDGIRIMKHINPFHGHPELMDDLYRRNSLMVSKDKQTYFHWEALNFGL